MPETYKNNTINRDYVENRD